MGCLHRPKTGAVEQKLTSYNTELVTARANMTHFFQPLNVNVVAKKYVKKEFSVYYSSSVKQQLDSGKNLTFKPLTLNGS